MPDRTVTIQQIMDCKACMDYYHLPENRFLPGACASVGIEHGKSTRQMIFDYLAAYHFDNDHEGTRQADNHVPGSLGNCAACAEPVWAGLHHFCE